MEDFNTVIDVDVVIKCLQCWWVLFLRMFWNFISSLPVKRGGLLSFLVGTIGNVLVMEIGWTDVDSFFCCVFLSCDFILVTVFLWLSFLHRFIWQWQANNLYCNHRSVRPNYMYVTLYNTRNTSIVMSQYW
jgi:hypothetical protein